MAVGNTVFVDHRAFPRQATQLVTAEEIKVAFAVAADNFWSNEEPRRPISPVDQILDQCMRALLNVEPDDSDDPFMDYAYLMLSNTCPLRDRMLDNLVLYFRILMTIHAHPWQRPRFENLLERIEDLVWRDMNMLIVNLDEYAVENADADGDIEMAAAAN